MGGCLGPKYTDPFDSLKLLLGHSDSFSKSHALNKTGVSICWPRILMTQWSGKTDDAVRHTNRLDSLSPMSEIDGMALSALTPRGLAGKLDEVLINLLPTSSNINGSER